MRSLDAILRDGRKSPGQALAALEEIAALRARQNKRHRSAAAEHELPQRPRMPRVHFPVTMPYPPPDMWLTLQNVASVNAGTTSAGYSLTFSQGEGLLLGWVGCGLAVSDQNLARSSLAMRLQFNGQEEHITNGDNFDYLSFENGFRQGFPYNPLMIKVTREDRATVYFKNNHALTAFTPDIAFAFLDTSRARLQER